ncbi:MAG TPA: S41 family peptidase [Stellaceae bacterium]|nr:S41 family peptidase [Stellaceae bacterium]
MRRWSATCTGLALGAVLLAGCAQAVPPSPADTRARLFAQALDDVGRFYITPVSDHRLILSGLAGLSRIDGDLSVVETPALGNRTAIALLDRGRQLALYSPPVEGDGAAWGGLVSRAVARAKTASPILAAAPEDRIDEVLFDGLTGALDRFSHYSTPRTAHARRAVRDNRGGKPTVTEAVQDGIVIFHLAGFSRDTAARLAAELRRSQSLLGSGLRGIVLDLRGDPGGLLDQAVGVSNLFIAQGPIAATIGRNPASRQFFAASGTAIAPKLPLVALVDGGSASASEIVAAALQDDRRAVVVGSASYGKGTVQRVLPLSNGGELIVTWALLVRPSGYLLDRHGVIPAVCTSARADDSRSLRAEPPRDDVARDVVRGEATAPAGPPAPPLRSAAALGEADWLRLRRACPARTDDPPNDLAEAERLLADPVLYRDALDDSRRLFAPTAATLTPPNTPLISGLQLP